MKNPAMKHEFVIFQIEPVRPTHRKNIERQGSNYGKELKRYGQRRKQYTQALRNIVANLGKLEDDDA